MSYLPFIYREDLWGDFPHEAIEGHISAMDAEVFQIAFGFPLPISIPFAGWYDDFTRRVHTKQLTYGTR